MYTKPDVTRYSGRELLDLMGPVETGYCDIEVIGGDGCSKVLQVSLPLPPPAYDNAIAWQIIPDTNGQCSDSDESGIVRSFPDGTCFGSNVLEDDYLELSVNVCCLAGGCTPDEWEHWTLGLTFTRDNGATDTCDIVLDVLDNE
jgi:hypothetical protein